jgi:hypothetical protein
VACSRWRHAVHARSALQVSFFRKVKPGLARSARSPVGALNHGDNMILGGSLVPAIPYEACEILNGLLPHFGFRSGLCYEHRELGTVKPRLSSHGRRGAGRCGHGRSLCWRRRSIWHPIGP